MGSFCSVTTRWDGVVGRAPAKGTDMRYALLWLLGVPIPILIVIWLFFH
jgi:hypothetical protein